MKYEKSGDLKKYDQISSSMVEAEASAMTIMVEEEVVSTEGEGSAKMTVGTKYPNILNRTDG